MKYWKSKPNHSKAQLCLMGLYTISKSDYLILLVWTHSRWNRGGALEVFPSLWQQIKNHPYIVAGIIVVFFALAAFAIAVIKFGWDWTGFTSGVSKVTTTMITPGTTTTTPKATVATEQQPAKTLWDWLGLLGVLAIPLVVGLGAAWYTAQQGKVTDRENTDNQRETILQAYIDKMSELLLEKRLRESQPEDEVRKIARIRTITVLFQLDARRIGYVFAFLDEAGLMSHKSNEESIVSFYQANLEKYQFQSYQSLPC